jgi:hypothetical protein
MKHLLKNEKWCAYIHSIHGNLRKVNYPIDELIKYVETNEKWWTKMEDAEWNEFNVELERIDLIFDSKKIRHNFHNEWVLLRAKEENARIWC